MILIGAGWAVRASPWARETSLRGKSLPELEEAARRDPQDSLAQYYLAKGYYLSARFGEAFAAASRELAARGPVGALDQLLDD